METGTAYNFLEHLLFPPTLLNSDRLKTCVRNKTILITGASFGIGESLAHMLADKGAHLVLVARTEEKLQLIKTDLETRGARVTIFPTDLSQADQVQLLIDFLLRLPGGVDIIISNAGRSIRRSINDSLYRFHDFTRTIAINYLGPVQLILPLIPVLEKNKGHLINISSVSALLPPAPFWAAYQASKVAFDQWFRSVASELNAMDISTTTIYLPLVRTRMITPTPAYNNIPAMQPGHVARLVCRRIIDKRKRSVPWWLMFVQMASVLLGSAWEVFTAHYSKKN